MKKALLNPYLFAGAKERDRESFLYGEPEAKNTQAIVKEVADAIALIRVRYPESDVFAKNRKRINIEARRALIWILTKQLGETTVSVGKLLGLDHSTVINHRDNFEKEISPFPSDQIIKKLFTAQ